MTDLKLRNDGKLIGEFYNQFTKINVITRDPLNVSISHKQAWCARRMMPNNSGVRRLLLEHRYFFRRDVAATKVVSQHGI